MKSIWHDESVDPESMLWRYFRTDRLVESLRTQMLHFASAHQFEDPFEGAVAVLAHDFPIDPGYPELDHADQAFEQLRRLSKISCWHHAEYESAAMWKLYGGMRKGVAIRTTANRLQAALKPFRLAPDYGEEEPIWGSVRYVDLHAERLNAGMEQRFFFKHRAFEWEHEFRVIISVRMAEGFGVRVPKDGINVPFDPSELIESIYLGPNLSPEDREAVVDVCTACDLDVPFVTSTLLGSPRYT
jgi:hypothetical protein